VKPPHHSSPVHSHPEAQVLVALKGRLTVINNRNVSFDLDEGDTAFFAANEPHRVVNPLDTPSTGLDIFVPGRSFDFWLKRKK
jgi:quercetin dioxygenase-like cupin family protein